jgi:uncharacterized protein (TIGR02246 family)
MPATDPTAVVTRYIEAVRDGDTEAIAASFATDATWVYPGTRRCPAPARPRRDPR